jgi:hypothetical protein
VTKRVVTAAAVFAGVALAHFVVSIAGVVLGLRVWFDTAPGGSVQLFDLVVVRLAAILLAPLSLVHRVVPGLQADYPEIALTSAAFGAAAVGVVSLWCRLRRVAPRGSRGR